MKKIENAKRILANYRAENPNRKKVKYPKEFWKEAIKLSKEIPIQEIVEELGIDIGNFKRRINESGLGNNSASKISKPKFNKFLEVPMTGRNFAGKSITLDLPHNIKLRIEL